jgi:hypothetical protein
MAWNNDDGLHVKFGTEKPDPVIGGESSTDGFKRKITINLKYSDLAATGSSAIIADGVFIPDGVYIDSATFTVTTAFAGATATLTFGLIDADRTTGFDSDGIDAAIAVTAIDAVGDVVNCDGAQIGAVISNSGTPLMVTALEGTAAFTAGEGVLEIVYFVPRA